MFTLIGKIFDWILSFFGNIFNSFTLRDQNSFLQTKLAEAQKELAPSKERTANLETENTQLKVRVTELEQENNRQNRRFLTQGEGENLDENALEIIKVLSQKGGTRNLWQLEEEVGFPKIQLKYSLDFLEQHNFIESRFVRYTKPMQYDLTQKGRKFAIDKGLLGN